ncbi:Dnf1/Dnf2 [Kluyveromyces lactis]|nr:Dnf1/Dnf2 [Kluyveromyces lactis]
MTGPKKKGKDSDPYSGSFKDDSSPDSPFNDRFVFEQGNQFASNLDGTIDNEADGSKTKLKGRQGSILKNGSTSSPSKIGKKKNQQLTFGDTGKTSDLKNEEFEEISFETTGADDQRSYVNTPIINQGNFAVDEEDEGEKDRQLSSAEDSKHVKRMRWGTRRDKKGKPAMGRAKTLRWTKKNFHNPFADDTNLAAEGHSSDDDNDENYDQSHRQRETRTIYYNLPLPEEILDEDGNSTIYYPRNKIRTTKYTPLTFFPKNIAFQFKNVANVYFLVLIIMGFFQIFGVANPGLATVPLIVIVVLTAFKDAIEDSRRTILDMEVNNAPTHILKGVENVNVSNDKVSLWRKFKKANTRILFRFIRLCKELFTEQGKKQRAQRKRHEMHNKIRQTQTPRNSLDSVGSYRNSMESEFGGDLTERDKDDLCILDPSLPVLPDCKFSKDYWKSVSVGDIVRVHNNDEIPADIILLSSSDSDGACYVETKNLDGETNLKVRQSLKCSHMIRNSRNITRTKFKVESEGPHSNLYSYQGNLKWVDRETGLEKNEPVNINNLLLRGCTLRNTKWAMGIVVFTGPDTKIMLNAGITPTKVSRISRDLNLSVFMNFALLFVLCFAAGIVNGVYYRSDNTSRNYFEFGSIAGSPAANGVVSFWVALILYQSVVPISLYISIEIIKTAQALFIYGDVALYNERLDYPCTPKSWTISDDLGQIEYIFSDKTGTLTQNVMEFKKCTINGVSYGRAYTEALAGLRKRQGVDVEEEGEREKEGIAEDKEIMLANLKILGENSQLRPENVTFVSKEFVQDTAGANGEEQKKCNENFMLALALCHTVLVEENKDDPEIMDFKAQSPDEAALVGTARDMGFSFVGRTKNGVIVDIQGVQKEYRLLNVLEFNSTRKRMSCILKIPSENPNEEPRALLICKGADSIIYSRLSKMNDEKLLEKTALHLEQYATEGLRTLCIAQRELSWKEYQEWNEKHEVAAAALVDREDEMEKVADVIERELTLLGGTAIEDRLQDGVPDSIATLGEAGIKMWVLTGDKVETAINIGFSCNLLNNEMELLVIKASGDDVEIYGSTPGEIVKNLILKYLQEKFQMAGSYEELEEAKKVHEPPTGNFGVVIDGDALKLALRNDDVKREFLLLCKRCKAVLCCRVSPAQKAAVVKLVKHTLDVMTLAIGDGSNDVAMIQSADIGVGIAGEEGRQAVMSSDYAIGQFRYLTRLVLVHGRWSYKRMAEMIPLFFYKNVIFTLSLFWYGVYNNYDGSYLFEYTYLTLFNLAFTSLPVIFLGILDQDVNDIVSMVVPQLYRVGILRSEWNQTKFWLYMFDAVYQSIICFFLPYLCYYKTGIVTQNGLGLDHRYWVGVFVATIAVVSCNTYVLLHQYRWDWFSSLFIALSCLCIFAWTGIWSSFTSSGEFYKSAAHIYGQPVFWAIMFAGILFCLLPRFAADTFIRTYRPKDIDIIRECWKRGDFDHYPEGYDPTDPDRPKVKNAFVYNKDIEMAQSSTDSIQTEEIPMEELFNSSATSPRSYPHNRHQRSSGRPSLEITRAEMRNSNQLDNRYSVERARVSLELPGVTRAATLLSSHD